MTTFALFASAGAASAAPGQVFKLKVVGGFADAGWFSTNIDNTVQVSTFVQVDQTQLFIDQFTTNFDADGNFTGGTDTFTDVTEGYSFSSDGIKMTTGSLSGSGIPATTCDVDANFNDTNCTDTTMDLTVDFTGQGKVVREIANDNINLGLLHERDHLNETDRQGTTATGTLSGSTLGDSQVADLGFAKQGTTVVCFGGC
ncbi:MAG: hypothetical protein J2P27_13880 [Actinobacteria bacterium]|nr:hypothetical protein [Actinomycetota bacterium]